MNFLPGWHHGFVGGGAPQLNIEYIGSTENTGNGTSHTFTDHAIGTASADRLVVVAVTAGQSGSIFSTLTLTGVTIGGNAADEIEINSAQIFGGYFFTNSIVAGLYSLVVPAGTTATIVTSYDITLDGASVSVYTIKNYLSSTPTDTENQTTGSTGATSISGNIDITDGGCLILCGACATVQAQTTTGATEDFDNGNDENQHVGAHVEEDMASETARSVGINSAASTSRVVVAATWR